MAGNLWPEKTEEKARASLNTELWRIRQALGDVADAYLDLTRETAALNLPSEQVDIHAFRDLVKRGDASSLKQAVTLYHGEFLEGCYADWCLLEREQLSDLFRQALEGLLRYHESRGELTEAISFAKRVHSFDPLREDMHRALMRLYAALGDRPAALAQYQSCKGLLKRELGVTPMPETEALHLKIRQTAPLEDHWAARREAARLVTEHRLAELRRAKQYLPDLYAARPALDAQVEAFTQSEAVGLILVGHSGCGKTNYLARLAETRLAKGDLVLLLDAAALTLNIERDVARLAWGVDTISAAEALSALGRDAAGRGRVVWIMVDDLNAFRDLGAGPADLLRRLDALVRYLPLAPELHAVKLVFACREHPWQLLQLGGATNLDWQRYHTGAPLAVERYTLEEARVAFEAYSRFYQLQTRFDALTDEFKDRCRTPLLLRLTAETWQGKALPASGSSGQLFRAFFERVVANPGARQLVGALAAHIVRTRRPDPLLSELRADPAIHPALSDAPFSPLQQLIEAGVLRVAGSDFSPRLRFTHDRLLEYVLAQYYDAQCAEGNLSEDCLVDMARDSWNFPALWGAAMTLLLLGRNADQFILLAESDSTEARQLATEGLAALHEEDAALARLLANRLLNRPSVTAKRVALFAASRMGAEGFGVFQSAAGSREASTRQTALVALNALFQREPRLVLSILRGLLEDMSLRTIVISPAQLQTILRLIGVFTRYGLEREVLNEADTLIKTFAVKKLRLPTETSVIRKSLLRRILSIDSVSWPADRNAVAAVAQTGSLSPEEEHAFRRTLAALKRRADGLADLSLADLKTLLDSGSDAVRYLAHHQLSAWVHVRPADGMAAIQSLFDMLADPSGRVWLISACLPISAPATLEFSDAELNALEHLTARLAEEHADLFYDGIGRGTLSMFGPLAFLPLGMRYARAQRFDFPLFQSRLQSARDPQDVARHLRLLPPLGWFYPKETLSFFARTLDFEKPLHPQVAESLGRIWVNHPEVVDHFLRAAGANETTQRQVRTSVDIENTLRSIYMLHNTDLRVTSVLLDAPYGHWVTDWVFEGYVDSKSLDEAASRFGRGLVEIYMSAGWKLKKILGLEK